MRRTKFAGIVSGVETLRNSLPACVDSMTPSLSEVSVWTTKPDLGSVDEGF